MDITFLYLISYQQLQNGLVLPSPFGCHFLKPWRKNDDYCHSQKAAILRN